MEPSLWSIALAVSDEGSDIEKLFSFVDFMARQTVVTEGLEMVCANCQGYSHLS